MATRPYNTTKSIKKQRLIYNYCKTKIENGETFKLKDIVNDLNISKSSTIEYLQEISRRNKKFVYQNGNVVIVGLGTNMANNVALFKQENVKSVTKCDINIEKYDKNVKDIIADYILNSNVKTREEIVNYVNAIMNITDKLREKLLKEGN